ncbi:suppressor of cytokine signaling 3b [Erpetoichthys calabaricus]|uniref:Suppressor of cytokine signaling 3 n=1 Tax=Erpetoichthys calabaricus TaxID=27687 RepID=A0A8C4XE68_ERPCA|nr:suppressor of cytokine signaling 3b [Erpetoichthys calabaricus]
MVTHSKFGAAMSSCPFEPSLRLSAHRFKIFNSKHEYQLVINALRKLQESGFYWGTVSGKDANNLLSAEPTGTFLIRDSSDNRHFFTLSVKTDSGTKNLRIQCDSCSFFLQTDPKCLPAAPRFDCVLKLVHHYMPSKNSPSPSGNGKNNYFIHSSGEKIPLELLRPLLSGVSTLQHLCRKTVNGHLEVSTKREQLPHTLKEFLQEYDSPV